MLQNGFRRAIEFDGPRHIPVIVGFDPDLLYEQDAAKLERIDRFKARIPDGLLALSGAPKPCSEPVTRDGVTRWVDHWGTGWEDDGHGAKTETYPLQEGYALVDGHAFPDPHAEGLFGTADAQSGERGERYVIGFVWFTLFERLWMLRGFDNMLMDPYVFPDDFAALRDRIVEYNLCMIDQWIARGVDGIYFSDDWGSQRGLLMNPDDWRRHYKPSYERMFRSVREGGAHVWMHLCGNITAILPDLIEIGLNVLNPVQPQAMDVDELARDFGGRVCFCGGVDVQGTLIAGTPDDVRAEVAHLVTLFGSFNGGYIASTSHSIMPETPLDNVIALYEAFADLP